MGIEFDQNNIFRPPGPEPEETPIVDPVERESAIKTAKHHIEVELNAAANSLGNAENGQERRKRSSEKRKKHG